MTSNAADRSSMIKATLDSTSKLSLLSGGHGVLTVRYCGDYRGIRFYVMIQMFCNNLFEMLVLERKDRFKSYLAFPDQSHVNLFHSDVIKDRKPVCRTLKGRDKASLRPSNNCI